MTVLEAFATRLKALREANGLSQDELGRKIGISRGSISFYEKQSRTPDIITLSRLSDFFEVSLDYLMGYSDSKTNLGVSIERDIGLSEDSINALRIYKLKYTADDIKMLNRIIQHQNVMKISVLIDSYNKSIRKANKLQTLILNYLKIEMFFKEHSMENLKEYLLNFDVTLEEKELHEINEFITSYEDLLAACRYYTAGTVNLIPVNEANVELLEEAEKEFSEIIDDLTCENNL